MDAATADSVWRQTTQAIGRYDFAEANKRLTEALSQLDGSARIPFLAQQGRVLGPMGRQAEAVEAVREAVDLLETPGTEGDAATWHRLGLTLCNARREAEALPLLKRATDLTPDPALTGKRAARQKTSWA